MIQRTENRGQSTEKKCRHLHHLILFFALFLSTVDCPLSTAFANGAVFGSSGGQGTLYVNDNNTLISGSRLPFVNTTPNQPMINLQSTGSNAIESTAFNTAGATYPVVVLGKSNGSTVGSNGLNQNNLGAYWFSSNDGTGQYIVSGILGSLGGTASTGSIPSKLVFYTSPSGSTTPTVRGQIDQAGDWIVGATAAVPGYPSNIFPLFSVNGTSANGGAIGLSQFTADSNGANFECLKSRNTTVGAHTAINSGDIVCALSANGDDGTNNDATARITFGTEGTVSTGVVPGNIDLATANASGSITSGLHIDSKQRVGVGTASPAASLQVAGNLASAAWTTNGIGFRTTGATYTDTSSSGTVSINAANAFAQPTFAASSATTYSTAATVYIANAPAAGTNVTETSKYALFIDNGAQSYLSGQVTSGGAMVASFFYPTSSTVPGVGMYLPATNQVGFATNSTAAGYIDPNQHWHFGNTAATPTLSACGSAPSMATGSTDNSGQVNTGGGTMLLSCTVNFAATFATTPFCIISPRNVSAQAAGAYISAVSTTAFTLTTVGSMVTANFAYHCF